MTRREAKMFISSLINLRTSATDKQAVEAPAVYPEWKVECEYDVDERVLFDGVLYKVIQSHTSQESWTPENATSLFAKVLIPNAETIYAWEQPDSTNPYMIGDKVMYNDKVWISIIDNNVWTPSVYGWEEVQE